MPLDDEQKLNIEISENEARKDFSKSERMEYALRLAEIERLKAEERMKSGKADPTQTFAQGGQGEVRDIVATKTGGCNPQLSLKSDEAGNSRTDEVVAQKLGIGSGKQFDKEKYIYENQSSLAQNSSEAGLGEVSEIVAQKVGIKHRNKSIILSK